MPLCVVDASFMVSWSLDEQGSANTDVLERIFQSGAVAPVVWPLEIVNVLLMAERRKRLRHPIAYEIATIMEFPVEIDKRTTEMAWHRILGLAAAHGLTAYDAAYLELAMRRSAILVTLDQALAKAGRTEGLLVLPEAA